MSTEIRLKRFGKRSFKGGELERSTSLGKDKEFGVTVLAAGRVFQKRLSNSRIMGDDLRSADFLALFARERLEPSWEK